MTASEPETAVATPVTTNNGTGQPPGGLPAIIAQAEAWEKIKPGTLDQVLKLIEDADRRDNQRYWAEFWLRIAGTVCGLVFALSLCLLAKYFVDKGAPTQGAALFGVGAASMVTAFLTQRLRGGKEQ
ncbi:hypothetical protein [Nonomuraea angiospora]|uniref:hypothetical protein n=1 Tax=Nonomuraea angiospora TaxID=46172 RepID=UPI0029A03231|nr:hypothetical protein [Nonomuraea angiospora]MDX3111116.1 hypothetical protein [Nonomuraea angiospora]